MRTLPQPSLPATMDPPGDACSHSSEKRPVEFFVIRLLALGGLVVLLAGCLRKEEMKLLYAQRCLSCHGPSGRGDGPVATDLPVRVPDFRDTVQQKSVIQIRRIIKRGKGVMPAFQPALRNYEIQDMVRFVRILSMEGRRIEWWERFEPLVWAHCSVPWQYVLDPKSLREDNKP